MRINAISPVNATNVIQPKKINNIGYANSKPNKLGFIVSFRGGDKSQAIMFGVEVPPYNKSGGVATVMQDFRALRISDKDPAVTNQMKNEFGFYKQKNKVLVDPFYNGFISYDEKTGITKNVEVPKIPTGLPADSPFKKYEGRYFQTSNDKFQDYLSVGDFFKNEKLEVAHIKDKGIKGNVFILEDVTGGEKKLDFGGLELSDTKLFRVQLEVDGKLKNTNDYKVFTDLTASLVSPYEAGGYSTVPGKLNQTWKGVADAKASKAFVEFLPRICELASKENGVNFDPATIILNDSQAGYASEFIAQKASKGEEFWKGKKGIFIGHNLGDGYVQRTSYMNMFMNIADKELRNAVYNNAEYIEAAKEGTDAVELYFKKYLPKECLDMQERVSPFRNTLYWAEKGLIPRIIPVSEMYAESIATDPEFAPAIHKYAKDLYDKNIFRGILNAFENVEFDPASNAGPGGYYKETFNVDVNGKNVKIEPLLTFDADKIKEGAVDVKHVREIKQQNRANVLSRFDADFLNAISKLREVKGHESDYNKIVLGLENKEARVFGYIKKDIIEEAKKPNSKVRMIAGWGRIDSQKAMDSAIMSFIDYLKLYGNTDKHSVLFVGGPRTAATQECINIMNRYAKDPDVAGRIVFIDGFLPNKPFASAADFTVFPSRFAPCELTDLESAKMFASPIVTDLQGLAQKNFDASFSGEADKVSGYKTKHAYTIHLDEMKKLLNEEDNAELAKSIKQFHNYIKAGVKGKILTEDEINKKIMTDAGLNYQYNFGVLRPFRDKIVERDLTECYRRALIEDNGKPIQDTMLQNLRKMKTDWENNGALKKDGISSAQKYREAFNTDPKAVKEEDTLLYKLRQNCKDILETYKKGPKGGSDGHGKKTSFWGTIKKWSKTKAGKWTLGIIGGAAGISAIGYAGYKTGWLNPHFVEEKKPGHLSQIG